MKRNAMLAAALTLGLTCFSLSTQAETDTQKLAERVRKDMEIQLKREDPEMASVKFVSMELTPTGDNKYRGTLQALDDQETEQVLVDVEVEGDDFPWTIVE